VRTILVFCCAALVTACAPAAQVPSATPSAAATATPMPQATATPTPTPVPSTKLAPGVRRLDAVGGRAVTSPDGKWLGVTARAGAGPFPFHIFDVAGNLVRTFDIPTPNWRWIDDSSGIFVALDAPQRSPALGIVELGGGAPRDTGLQMSFESLSRDGKWVVAAHEEGCCVAIVRRDIWAAPRVGGPTRVVATAKSTEQQAVAIFGHVRDRVVYRDADMIFSVPITGGTPQRLGTTAGDWRKTFIGSAAPDGTVLMVLTVDPAIWSVVTGDKASAWPSSAGEVVAMSTVDRPATTPVWTADHSLLARSATGALAAVNVVSLEQTPLAGKLEASDIAFAYRQLKLLVARGGELIVLDIASNSARPTGIDVGLKAAGVSGWALPGGGFIVALDSGTYRID
jgi:hypothetical protein